MGVHRTSDPTILLGLFVWQVCFAKSCEHTDKSWSALEYQVCPSLVARVGKQSKAKSHELWERQPRRKKTLPVKIRKPKECRKKLPRFSKIQFEQHVHAKGEKLPLAQTFFWPDSLPYLGGHFHSFLFIAGAIWCTCTYNSFNPQTTISVQRRHSYTRILSSETTWKVKTAFPQREDDVLG